MTPLHRLARLVTLSAITVASMGAAGAQTPAPRLRGPIEAAPSVTLAGSLNPHLRTADDLGPLAPDTAIRGITLVFARSAQQEADLQQLLAQQVDPSSPLFHHWLTPDEFAARFGLADSDIAATQTWLRSHGFSIDDVSRNRDRITFSGTAAEIQQAFGAELHHFRWQNELHFAPASALSLPPSLAPVTAAVLHLSDFRPKPNVRPHPDYTTVANQSHFLTPKDIAVMYDLSPLLSNNFYGSGQSIAVVGQSFVQTGSGSAVWNFAANLTGATNITPVLVPGTGVEAISYGNEGESDIDLEYSSGTAINASVFFVYSGSSPNHDVNDAIAFAISTDIAPIITISYSECETLLSAADAAQYNALYEQASAQGQTIVAAGGDSGATGCAAYDSQSGLSTAQQQALAVGFPASSPNVTAVGGTQMAPGTFAAGASSYWAPPSGTLDVTRSLLSYVPETVWNEDSSTHGIFASGGGASAIFPRPAWQSGVPGMPSGGFRLLPDIALQASIASPGYLVCSEDPSITGATSDCLDGLTNSNGTYVTNGGTSFGAPILAGFLAILNQYEHTTGLGNINPVLYGLASQPSVYATAFHDITSGTSECLSGDGNCGSAGQNNYAATTGYDLATGLGSVDFGKLAAAWPSTTPSSLIQTVVTLIPAVYSIPTGATDAISISVGSVYGPAGTTTPTGAVALYLDGQLVNPALALTPSTGFSSGASYTFPASAAAGTHIISAHYAGDPTHLPSIGTIALPVGSLVASGSVTLAANNLTLSSNSLGSTQITITPSGGYNGALTWTATLTGGTVATSYCYLIQAPPINGTTTGTINFGVGTGCNSATGQESRSTVQRTSAARPPALQRGRIPAAAVLAVLLCGIFPSRRRKLLPVLALLAVAVLPLALAGCGGGGSGSGGGGGGNPQPQVYTVTVRAQDSVTANVNASTSFTLTVDQ